MRRLLHRSSSREEKGKRPSMDFPRESTRKPRQNIPNEIQELSHRLCPSAFAFNSAARACLSPVIPPPLLVPAPSTALPAKPFCLHTLLSSNVCTNKRLSLPTSSRIAFSHACPSSLTQDSAQVPLLGVPQLGVCPATFSPGVASYPCQWRGIVSLESLFIVSRVCGHQSGGNRTPQGASAQQERRAGK